MHLFVWEGGDDNSRLAYLRVEHVAGQEDTWNVYDVVRTTANTGRQRPEADGRCFADDDP